MSAIIGEMLIFQQESGSDVELVVFGDEFYARYETKDGYTVVYDPDRGLYCYAALMKGRFASSGVPVSKRPPTDLRRGLRESEEIRNEKFEQRYADLRPPSINAASNIERTFGRNNGLLDGRRVSEGQVRGLTILVEFTDLASGVTAADVDAMLNGSNYQDNGNFCSVRDYFLRLSNGKLDYSNLVVGPVKLRQNQRYYVQNLLCQEALDQVVNELRIDLSQFDSRHEGYVDALSFMYAGRTLYEGDLWPHNSELELTYNGIKVRGYTIQSLGRQRVDLSIGTFCHESGHLLCRFPDLYDYGSRDGDSEKSSGMGYYCLMSAGNHLNNGRTPAPICAYLRDLVGWCDREIRLNAPSIYEIKQGDYGTLMKYETHRPNEYFILENRTQQGLDTYIPSSGLAIYHCDTLGSNEWQGGTSSRHYQCGLLQADGHLDLETNRNMGDSTDLFKQVSGVALSYTTMPSTRAWDGSDSGLVIADISAPGDVIRMQIGKGSGSVVKGEVIADLLIPDNQREGVSSIINMRQAGKVKAVKVSVDITHTYAADLQIELKSPSGKQALLYDRVRTMQRDLKQTFTTDTIPTLKPLVGDDLKGDWVLVVRDVATRDIGRLNRWSIEVEYEDAGKVAQGEVSPNLPIPDNKPDGISSSIAIAESGNLTDLSISVAIVHPYIGDLLVEIVAPSGQSVTLHNQTGDSQDDLRMTYDRTSTPALKALLGQPIQGDWMLRVKDLQSEDAGKLEKWSLRLMF
ncbi:M6 family metalloprotease domain-containing protein [Pantanalinema rosaneae CENA516]|uniref:M6 family metalloprotease domain-containing protein n=1 Tax=Pantanalinema rosaneae TaxID=1620701 RepID=UPI003D6E2443